MRLDIANTFPREIVGLIASHAHNFSQWVVMLGVTDPQIHMKPLALDQSAAALLGKMHVVRNENQSATDQLLTFVFEETFASSNDFEKLELIEKMKQCQTILDSYSFQLRYRFFQLQGLVAAIFANTLFQIVLSVMIARYTFQYAQVAKEYVYRHLSTTVVPKAVNFLVNHAPIQVIWLTNQGWRYVDYVIANSLKVRFITWGLVLCSGSFKWHAEWLRTIVLLPVDLPQQILREIGFRLFFRSFAISQQVQTKLAEASNAKSVASKNKLIAEESPKAFQLWKYLMKHPQQLYLSDPSGSSK